MPQASLPVPAAAAARGAVRGRAAPRQRLQFDIAPGLRCRCLAAAGGAWSEGSRKEGAEV